MGSFSISCGVSNQTIAEDDLCVAIPVLQERTFDPVQMTARGQLASAYGACNSICYPTAFWNPLSSLVRGRYVDYGRISPDDTLANRLVMIEFFGTLFLRAPVVHQGENSSHDTPFDLCGFIAEQAPGFATIIEERKHGKVDETVATGLEFEELVRVWDYVWHAAWENRLFCEDNQGIVRPVQFTTMHQASVDYLVRYAGTLTGWKGSTYELVEYLRQALATRYVPKDPDDAFECFQQRHLMMEKLTMGMHGGAVNRMLYPFMDLHAQLLEKVLTDAMSFESFIEAMRPTLEGVYLLKALEDLHLRFTPMTYGSQDYENEIGQKMAQFISAVCAEVTQQRQAKFD